MSTSRTVDVPRRLVERLGLGPRPGQVVTGDAESTLAALTAPAGPDPGVTATPPPEFSAQARLRRRAGADPAALKASRQALAGQSQALELWWLDRMSTVEQGFAERMTWFWHGHFATSIRKVRFAALMYQQNDTLRRLGRGDFRELARAMIVDPALLIWLDGGGNRVGRPNENLAREFMELFTLGVGHYAEDDVRQAARALTGWRVGRAGVTTATTATFAPRAHDNGPETVLGSSASLDAPGLVSLIMGRPEAARFLAGRVWTRFVSDTPPDEPTLDRLVAAYGPGHDVTALVRAAVRSPEFADPAAVLVKEPVLWLVGAMRALRTRASALPAPGLSAALTGLGQVPFAPLDVGGWPSGTPWLTTAAALARLRAGLALARAGDLGPVADAAPGHRVDAAAALLGLPGFTDRTAAALAPLAARPEELVACALTSPEYTVSA